MLSTLNARVPADSWVANLFTRPSTESVHADDEEFDAALSGNTALTVSGSAAWAVGGHQLSSLVSGQTDGDLTAQLWPLTPVSAPVTIQAALSFATVDGEFPLVGIGLSDGVTASDTRAMIYVQRSEGGEAEPQTQINHTDGTFTAHANAHWAVEYASESSRLYLRYIWAAANSFKAYLSPDGVSWTAFGNGAASLTMTPSHFFVSASTWASAAVGIATFDYLRVTEADLSL